MFKSLAHESTLTERAQVQIENLIVEGSLRAGDRLPSERELTEKLGVSKTVVREAVRSLVTKGLLDVRVGSGMYVRDFGMDMMKEPMKLLLRANALKPEDVHEVRAMMEIKIAGLAAERALPGDIKAMQETIHALGKLKLTAREFAETDVRFHNLLAKAAGNPLFAVLVHSLNDVLIEARLRAYGRDGAELVMKRAASYHSSILDRVRASDAEGAQKAMEDHLTEALDTLRRATDWERKT